jgi:hypothetical protein
MTPWMRLSIREYLVAREIGKLSLTRHSAKSPTVACSRGPACGRLRRHRVTPKQYCYLRRPWRAISVRNWARQNPPFCALSGDERAQQFAFRSLDAKFLRVDLDALRECAKVIASRSRHACPAGGSGLESASWQKPGKRNRGCSSRTGRTIPRAKTPRSGERGVFALVGSIGVGLAAAGPDQGVGLGAFVVEEVRVDRRIEARIVELDREIIAALVGALGPRGSDFGVLRCTAKCRLCGEQNYA